jgi:RNA polymerase sigma factor (sigma-70 family)
MDPMGDRSKDVTTASTATLPATAVRALDFDALYRDARDDVFAYTATLLRDSAAAEDVTAQAFERAYQRRSRFDARRGSPRAWLFGIARNAALDELRRRKRSETAELPAPPSEPAPDEAAQLAAERDAVRRALGTVPAKDRELIALKYHADLSNGDIAAVLGINANHVGTLLHRAMNKLREAVDA